MSRAMSRVTSLLVIGGQWGTPSSDESARSGAAGTQRHTAGWQEIFHLIELDTLTDHRTT